MFRLNQTTAVINVVSIVIRTHAVKIKSS